MIYFKFFHQNKNIDPSFQLRENISILIKIACICANFCKSSIFFLCLNIAFRSFLAIRIPTTKKEEKSHNPNKTRLNLNCPRLFFLYQIPCFFVLFIVNKKIESHVAQKKSCTKSSHSHWNDAFDNIWIWKSFDHLWLKWCNSSYKCNYKMKSIFQY